MVVSVGESVRIVRELQELTQSELWLDGPKIPQSTISAIETILSIWGSNVAKTLVRVLQCHPAVLGLSYMPLIGKVATS